MVDKGLSAHFTASFWTVNLVALQTLGIPSAIVAQDRLQPLIALGATVPLKKHRELKFLYEVVMLQTGEMMMQAAIDRVMHTYGMLVNLTLEQEHTAFLAQLKSQDENKLAVEGIKFLRGDKLSRQRRRS